MWFTSNSQVMAQFQAIEARLAAMDAKLDRVLGLENQIVFSLTGLIAAVQQETTVEKSAVALLQGLAQQLAAVSQQLKDAIAANDPAAIAAAQAQIDAAVQTLQQNNSELAGAVTANTPAAPTPPQSTTSA